jgi:hypothetical protein
MKNWVYTSTAVFELIEKTIEGQINALDAALAKDQNIYPCICKN